MAKLTDFETPTGQKGNLFNPMDLLKLMLGSAVLLITFTFAQKFVGAVSSKIPAIPSQPNDPFRHVTQQSAAPAMRVV